MAGIFEILSLIIAARGVKPAVAMKTLSGLFALVVIAVITTVVVVGCCNFPLITDTTPYAAVEIGHPLPGGRTYVEWKGDGTAFYRALEQVRRNGGEYCLCEMKTPDSTPRRIDRSKCTRGYYDCPRANIRTVKVTKSKAADNIAAGASAVNDPNITYRIQSSNAGDIIAVLDALK